MNFGKRRRPQLHELDKDVKKTKKRLVILEKGVSESRVRGKLLGCFKSQNQERD